MPPRPTAVTIPPAPDAAPRRPSWSVILGMTGAMRAGDQALRDARAAAARRRRWPWLVAQAMAVSALVVARGGAAPWPALLSWAVAVLALCATLAVAWSRAPARTARAESEVATGLLFGSAWGVAVALFGGPAASPGAATVLGLSFTLIAVAGTLGGAAPLGGLAFIAICGGGAVALTIATGAMALSVAASLSALAGAAILLANARGLVLRLVAEQALAEQSETVSLLLREFQDSADWLWRTDAAKRLIEVTPRLARQFCAPVAAVEGRPLLALLAGEDWDHGAVAPGVRDLAERLTRLVSFRDLVVPVTIAGERRWWSLTAAPRRDARGRLIGFWGVGTDVTERHQSAERIDRMARFDALTGLANRAHVIEALGTALLEGHRSGRRSTLMMIDLDRFKQVNDTLGHPIGDRLLGEVSSRLRALVNPQDLCGRLGGDEFAVVVADADDRDRVEALAEIIVAALSAPYDIDGHRLHIGASVGSATSPRDGRVVETMLRNADLALYRAKDDGRGLHRRYEPQFHAAAERRRNIEGALREAIERGELRLVYQPIVESRDGRLAGFEALLRWTHPELGPIAPDLFLVVAEEARLIGRIGDWVMHTACRDAATWAGGVRVAVNLAAAQLRDPQLAATVVTALSNSGLAPDRLELEVAETVFVQGGDIIGKAVDRLLMLGVRVALADFASGQLAGFLRKGRFASVKIAPAFVRGVAENAPESIAIVRAIVALADSMEMVAVAQGAETSEDYDRMHGLGCGRIQGWMVGQPLAAEVARALAEGERARAAA